jgi:hypothetical protein
MHLLAETGITPKPVALLQQDGDLFIAEEFLSGTRMDRWALRYQPGPNPPREHAEFIAVAARLCEVVQEFHSRGLVIRDLTPYNLFVDDSQVRLCDVEYVAFSGTLPRPIGTPGFAAPELRRGEMVNQRADLYTLGALFFAMCTGVPPFFAEDESTGSTGDAQHGRSRADRLAALLNQIPCSSTLLDMMSEIIVALLANDPEARPSVAEVAAWLHRHPSSDGEKRRPSTRTVSGRSSPETPLTLFHARTLIADISSHLTAEWSVGQRRPWPFIEYGRAERPLDIYAGVAGVLGVLVQAKKAGYQGLEQVVHEAAHWLKDQHQPDGADRQGLYLGNCGIAWALGLAAAEENCSGAADRSELTSEVLSRLRAARATPPKDDDLISGIAGTVVGYAGILQAATELGLTSAERSENQDALAALAHDLRGRIAAPGVAAELAAPDLAGQQGQARPDYGFAHGLAGIGYALLAAGSVLGDDALIDDAAKLAGSLISARIGPADQAWWPDDDLGPSGLHAARWCNGSSGVATFLLRLWRKTGNRAAFDTSVDASRAMLAAQAGAPTCMCHGLAGDGELFLDLAAATGDPRYATAAWATAAQLWALRARHAGRWLIPDETGESLGVDFSNGMSGALAFLLRLCHGGPRLWMADDASGYPSFRTDSLGSE